MFGVEVTYFISAYIPLARTSCMFPRDKMGLERVAHLCARKGQWVL